MFTVIEILKSEKSLFERIISRIFHSPPELIKVAVKSGAPYFIIRVVNSKKIPWDDITYMAGRCASNIIVSDETIIPDDLKKRCFKPHILPLVMLSNTVCDLFSDCGVKNVRLGINDPNAVLCDKLEKFVNFSSEITVATNKREDYASECEALMNNHGISIVLAESSERLKKCDVVISETPVEGALSLSTDNSGNENALEFFNFNLHPVYEQKKPDGIKKEVYAGALYELCGVKRIGDLKFQNVKINNQIYSVEELKNRSAS